MFKFVSEDFKATNQILFHRSRTDSNGDVIWEFKQHGFGWVQVAKILKLTGELVLMYSYPLDGPNAETASIESLGFPTECYHNDIKAIRLWSKKS